MSAPVWPTWLAIAPATQTQTATLDAAATLNLAGNPGSTSALQAADAQGTISNQNGAGGVNWYTFTLNQASDVRLATLDVAGSRHLQSVLSLYDTEAQDYSNPPINYNYNAPPYDPLQHRLMVQTDGGASRGIDRELAAGTYYLAVSGHGDSYFNPFLADSGYAGSTGAYRLLITASPLPSEPTDGPVVIAVDSGLMNGPGLFAGGSVLNTAPLAVYVDLGGPIDPSTVSLQQSLNDGSSVQLTYNPTGQFGDGNDSAILLNGFHYAPDATELQLQPAAPLAPGFYRLTLAGNSASGNPVLMDASDTYNLGQNSTNPTGQDFTTTFHIVGSGGGDDTAATAHNLGNITKSGIVQAAGAIGNDPAYSPSSSASNRTNPASQVNLYHFQINGAGNYEFSAEAFAGRIGSTLEPALSLFRVDPNNTQGLLQLVASNHGSGNQTLSSNGQFLPLVTDPVLDVGLTAGDYYVAVSSSGNMPDLNGHPPGSNGIFDPNVTDSGANGSSTGPYVLNVLVQPAAPAPRVVSTSLPVGGTLTTAPMRVTVTFNSTVNLIALANQADSGSATTEPTFPGVFIVEPNGQELFPGLLSYDAATNQATFLMLDRLPTGANELHLSGANGLTGLGGNPLFGNDLSGDYVVSFTVADPAAPADPLYRTEDSSHDLGVLFPSEVQNGVTVAGTLAAAATDVSFTMQLSESQEYQLALNGPPLTHGGPLTTLPENLQITMTDGNGLRVTPLPNGNANVLLANLIPGTYTIHISRSAGDAANSLPYDLLVTMLYAHDNPPPLSVGATPVLQIRALSGPPSIDPVSPAVPASPAPSSTITFGAVGLVALTSRADLAGGVTNIPAGSAVALAAPLQVQGLGNGPVSFAVDSSAGDGASVAFAITALTNPTTDYSLFMDFFNAAWSEWQSGELSPRAAPSLNIVPRVGLAQMNVNQQGHPLAAPMNNIRVEPAADSSAVAESSEETPNFTSGSDVSNSGTPASKRSPLTWIAAVVSTALAAFLVWGRTYRTCESNHSLKSRSTKRLEATVKLADCSREFAP